MTASMFRALALGLLCSLAAFAHEQEPAPRIHPNLMALMPRSQVPDRAPEKAKDRAPERAQEPALESAKEGTGPAPRLLPPSGPNPKGLPHYTVEGGRILVEAVAGPAPAQTLEALKALGFELRAQHERLLIGFLPVEAIARLNQAPGLLAIQAAFSAAARFSGKVATQGDHAMGADAARETFGLTGKGVKVGIVSDSYDAHPDTVPQQAAAAGVAAGELPGPGNPEGYLDPVEVLADMPDRINGSDEGRAMAEIVHDVAPGATLAFASGFMGTKAEVAQNIRALAAHGCKVISDDTVWLNEPYFKDGLIAKAIDGVQQGGVAYFAAAGNWGSNAYSSTFNPLPPQRLTDADGRDLGEYVLHNFNPSGSPDAFQGITLNPGDYVNPWLQWNDLWLSEGDAGGAAVDLDMFLAVKKGDTASLMSTTRKATPHFLADSPWTNKGADPYEFIVSDSGGFFPISGFINNGRKPVTVYLLIGRKVHSGDPAPNPSHIRWISAAYSKPLTIEYAAPAEKRSTLFGRMIANGTIAVGAAPWNSIHLGTSQPAVVEPFSSRGGTQWTFVDEQGRVQEVRRRRPDFVAPDGVHTSFFYSDEDEDGIPDFFGTSAASPHAAGVAALMLEAAKGYLTPTSLRDFMNWFAAEAMTDPEAANPRRGWNTKTGHGILNADFLLSIAMSIPGSRHSN